MINELNILILEDLLNSDKYTPLQKYFIWEKLKELKVGTNGSSNNKSS